MIFEVKFNIETVALFEDQIKAIIERDLKRFKIHNTTVIRSDINDIHYGKK